MRLLVDLQACQGPSATRGIGYYALSLTRALAQTRGEHQVLVLLDAAQPPQDLLRLRHRLAPWLGRDDVFPFPAPPSASRHTARADTEAAREAAISALQPDVVLVTSVFELAPDAPMSVGEWCSDVPTAAVLYDLIPLTDLDLHKADPVLRQQYLRGVERLQRTDLLLSISDFSASEADRLLEACPPAATIHGAAPEPASPRRPVRAPDLGFAFAVGLDEPRKDLPTAVLAWAALPEQVRAGRPFVIAGAWPEDGKSRLRSRATAAGLPAEHLIFLGAVDDQEMTWLHAAADLFVFPSLVEGLGLPPLEAARAGTPVLLARSSSLVELFDDDAAYFPPGDVAALCASMTAVLNDQDVRDRLQEAGHRADERFTWERTAQRAWAALASLPAREPGRRPSPTTAHTLQGDLRRYDEELVTNPGVVILPSLDDLEHEDLPTLLAPAVGGVVRTPVDAARALQLGLTGAPVVVADVGEQPAAVEHCWATDVATHWAAALTPHALEPVVSDAFLRRPRWSNQPRGPLLASDVSIYRSTAFLSGIQRATRRLHGVLSELLLPAGGAVVPVQFGPAGVGTPHPAIASDPVLSAAEVRPDEPDWILCLDLDDRLTGAQAELQAARAAGVGVITNVFDLLPWAHPEWWPPGAAAASFVPWLRATLRVSDVLLVNSEATGRELARFIADEGLCRPDSFAVQLLRLGADLEHAGDASPAGRDSRHLLMVGTVEPRKGHREVLDAMEELWRAGEAVRLTVLGRAGWMVDEVVARMEALTESQPLFRWQKNAPDHELDRLYATCTAVLVASEAEGFGLPVVEAAVRGCPVVVRDIPVLRELAGDTATYFGTGRPLANVLRQVLRDGAAVPSLERVHTWDAVGRRLLDVLAGHVEPLARWSPAHGWAWT